MGEGEREGCEKLTSCGSGVFELLVAQGALGLLEVLWDPRGLGSGGVC